MRQLRSDGSASLEFIWVTLILLVPFVYILLAVFDVQRAAYAVSVASKSATRAYLLSPDPRIGEQRARHAAQVALDDQGIDARVTISCLPTSVSCLQPGSSVRVLVNAVQPLPFTPTVLGDQLAGVSVVGEHREPFGSYRERR